MNKILKVAISIPTEGHTQSEAYDNHLIFAQRIGSWDKKMEMEKRNPSYQFYWFSTGRIMTAFAREQLTKQALKSGMDYMLMYDDDMLLPLTYMEDMIKNIEEHPEIDILSPLAFMRNPPHYAVIYTSLEGFDAISNQPYYRNDFVKDYPRNQLIECDAVGFGSVLINMRIVKKMKEPYFFSTTGTGEDIYFCNKAKREAKARIFVDTRIKLGHLGNPVIIDEDYVDKFRKDHPIDEVEKPYKYLNFDR